MDYLPDDELKIVECLRKLMLEHMPDVREKLAYNVPFYYGKRRICLIWPASVPYGGFKKGVLLGFCQGYKLKDPRQYLTHGTNKRVFYKIFQSPREINVRAIVSLLKDAVKLDQGK